MLARPLPLLCKKAATKASVLVPRPGQTLEQPSPPPPYPSPLQAASLTFVNPQHLPWKCAPHKQAAGHADGPKGQGTSGADLSFFVSPVPGPSITPFSNFPIRKFARSLHFGPPANPCRTPGRTSSRSLTR